LQQQNQSSVLGIPGGAVARDTVVMARLSLQAQF